MTDAGSINTWECPECGEVVVAVQVDDGTTPFMLPCGADGCGGAARSAFYPEATPEVVAAVAWEWHKPTIRWARRKGPEMLDHVQRGGLVIRPLADAGRAALEAR